VRAGQWKLHLRKDDEEIEELYDLDVDIGETNNLYADHPDVVGRLTALVESCRQDLGDEAVGIQGRNTRPVGRVDHPDTLTHYDPEHPYMIALYDLKDRG
ncbi:MAG: Cerebroside-sulfatase, partial [Candidatus Latescibacteria bacterium]|nr:Cerebroside-sulfatase [Candidatus Latescibacterota bacterium]